MDRANRYLGLTAQQAQNLWYNAQYQTGHAYARRALNEKDWINILGQIKENGENYLGVALYFASNGPNNKIDTTTKKWFKRYFMVNYLDNEYHFNNVEL